MKKFILLFSVILFVSCTQENTNSIRLGVDQTIKIPVTYVSVSANIQLEDSDAATVEKDGYEKLSHAVNLLEKLGYEKEHLEINSGEISDRSYRDEKSYYYSSSIRFDISELDKIDTIRRALLQRGVNSFSITAYKNAKEDSIYDQAYQQAIQKAKEKAQGLISNQQLEIGKILNISENVKGTFGMPVTAFNEEEVYLSLDAELSIDPVEPLFNKRYYNKRIEFTIEFALEE